MPYNWESFSNSEKHIHVVVDWCERIVQLTLVTLCNMKNDTNGFVKDFLQRLWKSYLKQAWSRQLQSGNCELNNNDKIWLFPLAQEIFLYKHALKISIFIS